LAIDSKLRGSTWGKSALEKAKQVIRRHVPLEAELVKQRLLRHRPLTHHQPVSAFLADTESGRHNHFKTDFFNGIGRKRP
jgi:hypothetical protein